MNYNSRVKEDREKFVVFHPEKPNFQQLVDKEIKCVSLDVGIKNLAVRIEIRKSPTEIIPVYFERVDLNKIGKNTSESTGNCSVDPIILKKCNEYLVETLLPYMEDADVIGIERQLPFNLKATRIYQAFITAITLLIHFDKINKNVIFFDIYSKLKYTELGCPTGLDTHAKKRWGIAKAKEILKEREDEWSYDVLCDNQGKAETKADDLADTVLQMEAWFAHVFVF